MSFQNYGLSVNRLFHINLLAPGICRHYQIFGKFVDPWESWCPSQDLNQVSPKYKSEALPLDPTFQLQKKNGEQNTSGKTSWKETIGTARCTWQDHIKVGLGRMISGLKWLWTGSNSRLLKHDNPFAFLQRQVSDQFNNYQLLCKALYHGLFSCE